MAQATEKAYAKVNLALDVTGVREDGYHLVRMVMQTVSLHDTVTVTVEDAESPKAEMGDVRFSVDGENEVSGAAKKIKKDESENFAEGRAGVHSAVLLPTDDTNLCVRAANLLVERFALKKHIRIDLEKRIPIAAGLAGGSTDAAAVLRLVRTLCALPLTDDDLERLSLPLGADIPYCIRGGTALCEGIGEVMTRLPEGTALPELPLLLVKPDFPVATGEVYRALDEKSTYAHPDVNGLWEAIKAGREITLPGNVLQDVTISRHPKLQGIKDHLLANGAYAAMMSGSGPTVFGLFYNKEAMGRCAARMRAVAGIETVAETVTVGGY